ncbi:MAG: TonB-dependent receptor [Bryobacteraceae bacterium]
MTLLILCAALLGGVVTDPSGRPVEGALVRLGSARTELALQRTGADGRFAFPDTPEGRFLLRVEKAGFAPWERPVVVEPEGDARLEIRLELLPRLDQVTVSAEAGAVLEPHRTPQRITLLPAALLDQQATRTLSEAFTGETGVAEQRTAPAMGSVFVRGLTGKNVSVYRDGVRVTTSAQRGGVSTFFNLLEPATVEAVEVLRGPNSAQYGSDSIGGAIHVLSRGAPLSPVRFLAGAGAAFYDSATHAFGSQLSPAVYGARFSLAVNLASRRINNARTGQGLDSHSAITRFLGLPSSIFSERLPDTAFTQYGGSLHAQARLSETLRLSVHYDRSQQDGAKRYDQLLGGDGNLIADLRNLMADFGYVRLQSLSARPFERASVSFSYNAQREERVNQGGNGNPAGAVTHQYERLAAWGVQLGGERRLGAHTLYAGAEGYHERSRAPAFTWSPASGAVSLTRPRIPSGARYLNYGVFVQDAWEPENLPRLRLSGALRFGGASYRSRASESPLVDGRRLWPDDSLAANALSGRAGATFRAAGFLWAHFNYARAFRAPSMTDLGTLGLQGNGNYEASYAAIAALGGFIGSDASANAVSTGRPVEPLRPESSDSIDYGLTLRTDRLRLGVDAFWSRLTNIIVSQTLILPPGAVGLPLGDQVISAQLPSGAVYVPAATNPVLVRANYGGARLRGVEELFEWRIHAAWSLRQTWTWIRAADAITGAPPDIEPGIPAPQGRLSVRYAPARLRLYVEAYVDAARRQTRLSTLALSDRRIGAARSRSNIANFFARGARVRGLTDGVTLLATGETLAQVQQRVLGNASSAPMFTAIAGYTVFGFRAGAPLGANTDVIADFYNLGDRNYRGIGWGMDALGRGVTLKLRRRF